MLSRLLREPQRLVNPCQGLFYVLPFGFDLGEQSLVEWNPLFPCAINAAIAFRSSATSISLSLLSLRRARAQLNNGIPHTPSPCSRLSSMTLVASRNASSASPRSTSSEALHQYALTSVGA